MSKKTDEFLKKIREAIISFTAKMASQDEFYQEPVYDDVFLEDSNHLKPPVSSHSRKSSQYEMLTRQGSLRSMDLNSPNRSPQR